MRKGRGEEGEEGGSSLVAGHSEFVMFHDILVLL